jgi:hypothetical protein
MILILKKGRFGNYLFQFFVAKIIQSYNNSKIVTISKNENNYFFNSRKNIDSIVSEYTRIPYISLVVKFISLFAFKLNDKNIFTISDSAIFKKKYIIIIDGFFQDYELIKNNITILKKILKKNQTINNLKICKNDLTIHIRHLHKELGSLDTNPLYSNQPDINFYKKVIDKLNPDSIKVISSKKNKMFYKLRSIFPKKKIVYETLNDVNDFYNLINSNNLIISNSTFAYWAALLSKAKKVYIQKKGLFSKQSKLLIRNNRKFKFID